MVARSCACGCGRPSSSKWFSEACRKRFARSGGAQVMPFVGQPDVPDADPDGSCRAATLAELVAAGREGSALGQAALVLARRIDANLDTGSALAGAVKQLEATLVAATKGAQVQRTALDELRSRRDAKRGA